MSSILYEQLKSALLAALETGMRLWRQFRPEKGRHLRGKLRECKSFSNKYSMQNIQFCDTQYCLFPEILPALPADAESDCGIKFQLIVNKTPSLFLLSVQSS